MEHQLQSSVDHDLKLRVRASDPLTSVIAAENSVLFAGPHKLRILGALEKLGPATAHHIASACGLTVVQVDRRLPELKRDGQAEVVHDEHGNDVIRDGFRVWAVKKNLANEAQ